MALSIDTGYPKKGKVFSSPIGLSSYDVTRDRYGQFWAGCGQRTTGETYNYPTLIKISADYESGSLIALPSDLWGIPASMIAHAYVTSICIDDDGLLHMVGRYKGTGDSNNHIFYARYDPINATWDQEPQRVDTDNPTSNDEANGYVAQDVQCSLNGSNEVFISWEGVGYDVAAATKWRIITRCYYKSAGTWTRGDVVLIAAKTSTAYGEFGPQICEDSVNASDIVIVYQSESAGNDEIWIRSLSRNGSSIDVSAGSSRSDVAVPRLDVGGPRKLAEVVAGANKGHYAYTHALITGNYPLYLGGEASAYVQVVATDTTIRGVHHDGDELLMCVFRNDAVDNDIYMIECTNLATKAHAAAIEVYNGAFGNTIQPRYYYPQVLSKRHAFPANGLMFFSITIADVLGEGETDYAVYVWHINTFSFPAAVTPTPTGISPDNGDIAGGTSVTITGTEFEDGATVKIGGVAATNVVVVDSTEITCDTPAGSAGAADVAVFSPGLVTSGTDAGAFTYTGTPPTPEPDEPTDRNVIKPDLSSAKNKQVKYNVL